MSFTGEIGHSSGLGTSFGQYANKNAGFYERHVGEPIVVRLSKGYWLGSRGSGHPDDHVYRFSGVSIEREYSLGIIGSGSMEVDNSGLAIPVESFVTWKSREIYRDPTTQAWLPKYPPIGIEWLPATVTLGEEDHIKVAPIAGT